MADKKTLQNMFDNLLHIGNKQNHWNPKMKEYIYASTNGVHVFNLVKTSQNLENVQSQLKELTQSGKQILFVATKLQARDAFAELATNSGNFYVNEKWVPGLLTNFKTIKARIVTYIKLLHESETGGFDILTKKEKAAKMLELEKLDKAFKGVKNLKKIPDVVFVVDGAYEKQAVKEAQKLGIPTFAIANTNTNPDSLSGFIPANTNSVKSIHYIADALLESSKVSAAPSNRGQRTKKIVQKKSFINKKDNTNNTDTENSSKEPKKSEETSEA